MRLFIVSIAAATLAARANAQQPQPQYREQTADQQITQALNRLTFGPRPGDIQSVRKTGLDRWIDQQLHPERINDKATDERIATAYPLIQQNQNDLAHDYTEFVKARALRKRARQDTTMAMDPNDSLEFKRQNQARTQLVAQLESSRIARAVGSERQLQEVLTDFWENHFNVYVRKGAVEPYYLVDYDRTIREHALGKFRDLLGAVAHSPAMLFYLDNAESKANPGQPVLDQRKADRVALIQERRQQRNPKAAKRANSGLNENYGRELLELHTLGVDGGYTQQDVINVARALTGWTIRLPAQGGGFIFRPEWHDAAEKTVLGHTLPANRGEEDGEDVLDILARSPATAHFIAFKLSRRFVSDTPSKALVDRAANTFLKTDGDIREVVRTIVTSPEFYARAAYHAKVKSPFEVVVSAARALGAQPDTTVASAFAVGYLGAPLYGHQAPDGYPETGDAWMNTGAILNRINFGMAVAASRLPGASIGNVPNAQALERAPREQQVDAAVQTLLNGAASPDTRKILMSGEHPLAAAAAAQPDTMTMSIDPTVMTRHKAQNRITQRGLGAPPKLDGFPQVIGLALGSPEFQRR